MTVKEFKKFVNLIDEKYDNMQMQIEDSDYNEYCLGDGYKELTNVYSWHNEDNNLYYINFS